jgi:hypothetical protein
MKLLGKRKIARHRPGCQRFVKHLAAFFRCKWDTSDRQ